MHAVDEVPVAVPIFNCEFNGQGLQSLPSKYKPILQTQSFEDVDPAGDVDNDWHLLQVI
jgi:hypothetical protein